MPELVVTVLELRGANVLVAIDGRPHPETAVGSEYDTGEGAIKRYVPGQRVIVVLKDGKYTTKGPA